MPNFNKITIRNRIHLLKSVFDNTEEIVIGYQVYNLAKLKSNNIIFGDFNDNITYLVGNKIELAANESMEFTANNFILNGNLTVNGDVKLDKTLTVTGATTLNDILTVLKATDLKSTLTVTGATTLKSTLTVTGATTLNSTLNVTGKSTLGELEAGATALSSLKVNGATTLGSTLNVTGKSTLGELAAGATTLSSLTVNGTTDLKSTLTVAGTTTLGSTLTVNGTTTLNNDLNVLGDVEIGNAWNSYDLHVRGSCTINKDLYVTGKEAKKTLLNTALEVRDDASFKSDVYFYTNQNDEILKKGYISALAKEVKVNSINTTAYGINICALSNTINLLSDCNVYGDMYLYKSLTIDSSLTVNNESVFKKAIYLDSGKYRYITGLEKTINCSNTSVFETGKAIVNGITIGANVDGATSINLAGHCKVYDDLTVYGNSILHNNIYLNGYTDRFITSNPVDVTCGTSISSTGKTTVNGINIGSSNIASSSDFCKINLLGSCTIWKSLTVMGSNYNGNFNMHGDSFLYGTVTIGSTLLVHGSATIKGNINSDLLFGAVDTGKVDETSGVAITRNCKLCLLPNNTDRYTITYGNKTINDKTYSGILIGDLRDGLVYDDIIISGSCSVLNTTRLDGKLILKESYAYGTNAPQNATEGQIFFEYI